MLLFGFAVTVDTVKNIVNLVNSLICSQTAVEVDREEEVGE